MQPMGVIMLSGISMQVPYLRRVLDKIGVYPQIYKRKDYKSAYDMFTEEKMPKASRFETRTLIDDIASVLSSDIARDMGIEPRAFKTLVDKGLYMDQEALDAGLIDALEYKDVLIEKINEQVTGDPKDKDLAYVKFHSYVSEMLKERSSADKSQAKKIALVYAKGMIVEDGGVRAQGSVAFRKDNIIAADKLAPVLIDIAEDDDYDGVVLRIDSPGGSPVASETILRALQKVQEAGKSVTVSMGTVAASGGYWIACGADQIFVMPTTLTGSIGVLGGKFSVAALWDKLEVNWGDVSWGEKAGMWSMNQPYDKAEAERVNAMMDNVYTNFISRVAKGRGMSEDAVESVAKGRVWSGKRAVTIGLADQIGGLSEALDYAAVQVGAKNRQGVVVDVVPKPLTPIEQLVEMLESQVLAGKTLNDQVKVLGYFGAQIGDVLLEQKALSRGAAVYEPVGLSVQ
jgi:protease-4